MLRQFYKLTVTEFKIFMREPVAVFFNLFFPLMFLFLTMHVFLTKEAVQAGAINFYLPSFIIIITTGVSLFNIPIYIVKYRNNKFLKRLRVSPIRPLTILLSLGTANLLMLVVGLVILVVLGLLFYEAEFTGNAIFLILGLLLSFMSLGSIGLMIASFSRGMRTVNVVGQLIYYPMIFLSRAVPLELPDWLQVVSKLLPITYGLELTQRLWNEDYFIHRLGFDFITSSIWIDVVILIVVLVVCLFISMKFFKWE